VPTWIVVEDLTRRSPATRSPRIASGPTVLQLSGYVGLLLGVTLIRHVVGEVLSPYQRR